MNTLPRGVCAAIVRTKTDARLYDAYPWQIDIPANLAGLANLETGWQRRQISLTGTLTRYEVITGEANLIWVQHSNSSADVAEMLLQFQGKDIGVPHFTRRGFKLGGYLFDKLYFTAAAQPGAYLWVYWTRLPDGVAVGGAI